MSDQSRYEIDRRTLLAGVGGVIGGVGTLGIPTGTQGAFAATTTDPVSMAMHIHGSFSEGIASMDAHLYQARRLGVDVVWWTDHDFRTSAYGYYDSIDFGEPREPDGPWDLTWKAKADARVAAHSYDFVAYPTNPSQSGNKLEVAATAGSDSSWGAYLLTADAQNSTYSTSYCDTTLTLDVRAQTLSDDTRIVIEVLSSYRPATGGRPPGQYRIQYRLGDQPGYALEDKGLTGVVGLQAPAADTWQTVTLNLRNDHARLWPDTVADDASLYRLSVGVLVRNGASTVVSFDRLSFNRGRKTPADGMALLESVVAQYADRYPGITHYAASEISQVMHLNMFGGDQTLPTYTKVGMDNTVEAQRQMVRFLHNQGAVVSINHPLKGAAGPLDLAQRLVTTNGQGADVIEVGVGGGTGSLCRVFDTLARNAVFITANGTTDDHRGTNWFAGRRWLTRVWAPTKKRADLCAALKAGRAWFYDPARWDGTFDLKVAGGPRMGGVMFTRHRTVDVTVRATALPAAATVHLAVGRCDLAGASALAPANHWHHIPARRFSSGRVTLPVDRGSGCYVRASITGPGGSIIGFSNPVWILPIGRRGSVRVPPARVGA